MAQPRDIIGASACFPVCESCGPMTFGAKSRCGVCLRGELDPLLDAPPARLEDPRYLAAMVRDAELPLDHLGDPVKSPLVPQEPGALGASTEDLQQHATLERGEARFAAGRLVVLERADSGAR